MSRKRRIPPPRRPRWLIGLGCLGVVLLAAWLLRRPAPAQLLKQATEAFTKLDYAAAERLANQVPAGSVESASALRIAGDAAAKLKQFERAIGYYEQIADFGTSGSGAALVAAGMVHHELGHASDAERCWRRALQHEADNLTAHNALGYLLGVEGRSWEALPHILEPIRRRQFNLNQLMLLGSVAPIIRDPAFIDLCRKTRPDDPLPLLGRARLDVLEFGQTDKTYRVFQRIVAAAPAQIEAQARLGWHFVDTGASAEFYPWHAALPADADNHPEIWAVRGAWARNHGELRSAVRCFAEAVRRDPDHQTAIHQAGQTLVALGESDLAQPFLERAALLSDLTNTTGLMRNEASLNPDDVRHVAELTEQLGRFWESWGWCRVALEAKPAAPWAATMEARLTTRLSPQLSRVAPEFNPTARLDISAYPLPEWRGRTSDEPSPATDPPPAALVFNDRAGALGLDFRFFNGAPDDQAAGYMYETTGGGVAALDYDSDLWPDLFFTQGCEWTVRGNPSPFVDCLFRNVAGVGCRNVTAAARVGDADFSQGAAVGDCNSDGFADLFVANIGRNALYLNNGDGTFTAATVPSPANGDRWSTSAALADLDGDGHCDLYVVNYLEGPDVFTRLCRHSTGATVGCGPEHFAAAQDEVYRNLGDGQFEEATAACGALQPDGKGLGVVVADLAGRGRPDVFVANDGTANFHLVNRTPERGDLAFTEQALATGLAFDWQGRPQAGMGIAAGDADGDGRIDLFVTNFYMETNTLYRQHAPESFEDRTRTAGLAEPSLANLGFGTQFLDADLDGSLDLVVANGHVHNLAAAGIPFDMPPQLFHNRGDGHYDELRPAGDYFAGQYRGRGLARLDWNRDLRDDFAVSHLGDPAALVMNESSQSGHALVLKLRGAAASRDAIGAVATIRIGDKSRTAQLTAGDGYQCSNERQLTFGLGTAERVEELTIRWPSGKTQTFRDLPADSELMIIEGRSPLRMPPPYRAPSESAAPPPAEPRP